MTTYNIIELAHEAGGYDGFTSPPTDWDEGDSVISPEALLKFATLVRNEALKAENEALRAEVERLRSMTAVTMGIGRGDGNLFVHGDYDSIKVAQSIVFSANRMEKALKDIRSLSSMNTSPLTITALLADIHHIADAAMSERLGEGAKP